MKRFMRASFAFVVATAGAAFGQSTQPVSPATEPTAMASPATPTAAPTTQTAKAPPAPGSFQAFQADGTALEKQYKTLVPKEDLLADANPDRPALAKQAIPLVKQILVDLNGMVQAKPAYKWPVAAVQWVKEAELYALGDEPTVTRLDAACKAPGRDGVRAMRIVLRGRWYKAGQDSDKQEAVLADLEKFAAEQPGDLGVSQLVADIASASTDPDVKRRMTDVLSHSMDNMTADALLTKLHNEDKTHSFESKPMTLAGKLVDGKDFTTADWNGKVILVDFWATWCVPCRAELPRVQKMYADYHDKGLEVLGVDNDESKPQLLKVLDLLKLPWPELFDADAAAKSAWNSITVNHGIDGIPVMFLIDKKGICRSVTARDNFEQMIPQLLAE